jgi:hypothetical protein
MDRGVDYTSAPKSYEDLYRTYYTYVVSLVRQAGIEEDSKEDVASAILLRFYERDFLPKFNPDLVFLHNGSERRARFKSFLTKFVLTYTRGYREKQLRRQYREILCGTYARTSPRYVTVARPSGDNVVDAEFWFDLFGEAETDMEDGIIEQIVGERFIEELRTYLGTIKRRRNDMCDLVAVFDAVVEQVALRGRCDIAELRDQFGVSLTSMHAWLWRLRRNIAAYTGHTVPPKRSRQVAA